MREKIIRRWITDAIGAMEAGAFQSFGDDFLRSTYADIADLRPHGLTPDGKTRSGTPDSICELPNGEVIGVEYSTKSDYWKAPQNENEYEKWKPISDLLKCTTLADCIKVYLVSSQGIPTNCPQPKSKINRWAQENVSFAVEPLCVTDIVTKILEEPAKYVRLLQLHMPDVLEMITGDTIARNVVETFKNTQLPLEKIEILAEQVAAKNPFASPAELINLAAAADLEQKRSRFLSQSEVPTAVERVVSWDYFGGSPFGRQLCVTGPPKIGKSFLMRQLCSKLNCRVDTIRWYVCPVSDPRDEQTYVELNTALQVALLGEIFSDITIKEVLAGHLSIHDLTDEHILTGKSVHLIIIDNAEQLDDSSLKRLSLISDRIDDLCGSGTASILLISSRPIGHAFHSSEEIRCPNWTRHEILQLLLLHKVKPQGSMDEYAQAVYSFSGGHPLVALAIANRYPDLASVFEAQRQRGAALYDDALTDEIEDFLFQQLLNNNDERELLLRASVLLPPFSTHLLDHLCQTVSPVLTLPVRQFVRKQFNTLFEGSFPSNIGVSDVFQKVAFRQVADARREQIYGAAITYLTTPQGGRLDLVKGCDGITYAVLCHNLQVALPLTADILSRALNQSWEADVLRYVLVRLWIVQTLAVPDDPQLIQLFMHTLYLLARSYRAIGDTSGSDRVLAKLVSVIKDPLAVALVPEEARSYLKIVARMEFAWRALELQDYAEAARVIDGLTTSLTDFTETLYESILGVLSGLTVHLNFADLPMSFLTRISQQLKPRNARLVPVLSSGFAHIGSRMFEDHASLKRSLSPLCDSGPVGRAMCQVALAERYAKENDYVKAINSANQALDTLATSGIDSVSATRRIRLVSADIFYKFHRHDDAREAYSLIASEFLETDELFDKGWCLYRLALLERDPTVALKTFEDAAACFRRCANDYQVAIVIGEMAMCYYVTNQPVHTLHSLESIIETYVLHRPFGYGRSAIVAVSLLSNLAYNDTPHEDDRRNKTGTMQFGLKRGAFASSRVLDDAVPDYGTIVAYSALAKCYQKYGSTEDINRCKARVFSSEVKVDMEGYMLAEAAFLGESSYRTIARLHVEALQTVLRTERFPGAALKFGLYLFVGWLRTTYTRISADSIPVLRIMRDGAKAVGSIEHLTNDQRAAVMILLLASLDDIQLSPVGTNRLGFFSTLLADTLHLIPEWIRTRIAPNSRRES